MLTLKCSRFLPELFHPRNFVRNLILANLNVCEMQKSSDRQIFWQAKMSTYTVLQSVKKTKMYVFLRMFRPDASQAHYDLSKPKREKMLAFIFQTYSKKF